MWEVNHECHLQELGLAFTNDVSSVELLKWVLVIWGCICGNLFLLDQYESGIILYGYAVQRREFMEIS